MRKYHRLWIGIIISLVLIFLFFYEVDFNELGRALIGADYVFIIPAVAVLLVTMGLKAFRWQILMRPVRKTTLPRVYPVEVIGHMANAVLPFRLGELVRAYLLGEKEGVSKIAVLATVVTARIIDGISLVFFVLLLSLFMPLAEWIRPIIYIAGSLFLFCIILLIVLSSSPERLMTALMAILKPLNAGWQDRLRQWLELFVTGLGALKNPGMVTGAILLSLLIWVVEGLFFYIVGFAFNLGLPFHAVLTAAIAANLALLIPSLPGGVGNFEYFCSRSIAFFGVATARADAYAIVLHISALLPIVLLGLFFMWIEDLSINQLTRSHKSMDVPEQVFTDDKD